MSIYSLLVSNNPLIFKIIFSRCEFSEKLDLNQFLQDPDNHLGHYTLHAVLVHSGK